MVEFRELPDAEWIEATSKSLQIKRYSIRTSRTYLGWLARYQRFRARRPHLDSVEGLRAFLTLLATRRQVSASTQKQALSAIRFAYEHGLGRPLPWLDGFTAAYRPPRLPVVLSAAEVGAILRELAGVKRLVAMLLYGSGLRLLEALSLRVKDVDFDRSTLMVRSGKGDVKRLHQRDLGSGGGSVALPGAFGRKSPASARSWEWQWVFPATSGYVDRETGDR